VYVKKEQQDRESSLEQLMRDALRAGVSDVSDTSDTSRCLGADTLAAWAEQTLSARERTAVENHAAECARCQAMLAAMVRTTPAPVAAPWWRVHMMAWMVPVSVGAAALIVWTTLPARTALESRQAATQVAEQVGTPAPPPAPATPPPPQQLADKDSVRPQARDESLPEAARKEAAADQERARQMDFRRTNPNDKIDKQAVSSLAKTEAAPEERKAPAAAATPAPSASERDARAKAMADAMALAQPASPAPAPVAPAQPAAAPAVPPAPAAQALPTRSAAAVAAGATNAAEARADRLLTSRVAAPPVVQIVSPNSSNRWRLMPDGAVQHSTDGGATWATQPTGADVTLTAGASPAPLVCWVIGPRGRVLLSRDGATWKRVSIAEPIDLVSIRATDDKSATVTAMDGRTFATADGGATWTPR
jgi:Putative zinc-finger